MDVSLESGMSFFLQYHNADKLEWLPLDEEPFLETDLGVHTRQPLVRRTMGSTVFLIVGIGRPVRYFLWETFRVERIEEEKDTFIASGTGWQLIPPQLLSGTEFESFQHACANFRGLRDISALPYCATLLRLAQRYHLPDINVDAETFCTELIALRPNDGDAYYARGFVRMRLGIDRQAIDDFAQALERNTEFAEEAREFHDRLVRGVRS
jgi:hypothetical protein